MFNRSLTLSVAAASLVLITAASSFAADNLKEPGALLREGTWNGDVGNHVIPEALAGTQPGAWPINGWTRLTIRTDRVELEPVLAPKNTTPAFLKGIVQQLTWVADNPNQQPPAPPPTDFSVGQPPNQMFLRVPGITLKTGSVPSYRFKNGTSQISPKLDYRYELTIDKQAFAFTVQNGLRGKNGAVYGSGAQYTIEYDGQKFEYSLGEYGWASRVVAIADLDGDGKPDFVISVGGNNSGYDAVLLSSVAKPGKNPATASLTATGC
jgi:hypothetical protein